MPFHALNILSYCQVNSMHARQLFSAIKNCNIFQQEVLEMFENKILQNKQLLRWLKDPFMEVGNLLHLLGKWSNDQIYQRRSQHCTWNCGRHAKLHARQACLLSFFSRTFSSILHKEAIFKDVCFIYIVFFCDKSMKIEVICLTTPFCYYF